MGMPYRYQYDTNPRKIKPEYRKPKSIYHKKSTALKNKIDKADKKEEMNELKRKAKIIFWLAAVFSVVFTISYRNSLIDEAYSKTETLKHEFSTIEKENEQLEVSIDNSLNLNNVEQTAKEKLGMTKLTSKQTVYITLPKQDYIESETEKIEKEEKKENILEKLF